MDISNVWFTVSYSISPQKDHRAPTAITSADETDRRRGLVTPRKEIGKMKMLLLPLSH